MNTVTVPLVVQLAERGRRRLASKPRASETVTEGRVPRISRLMALAIKFQGLLRSGQVWDQSELAQLAHVSQPRMTQIMNLLLLAPDIQEQLLHLPSVNCGPDPVLLRDVQRIAAEPKWTKQRVMWSTTVVR